LTLARVHSAGASVDNAMFDVGFAFEATRSSVETFQQNLTLVLETTNDLNVAVAYERTRLGPDAAERIRSYLQAIISDVAADPAHVLGDIILDKTQHLPDPSADLAHDVFSFS
jgi:non-ribosomal peptide synthetase component F